MSNVELDCGLWTVDCELHTVDCAFFYPRALARRVILP